jgi:hypothetical protein
MDEDDPMLGFFLGDTGLMVGQVSPVLEPDPCPGHRRAAGRSADFGRRRLKLTKQHRQQDHKCKAGKPLGDTCR